MSMNIKKQPQNILALCTLSLAFTFTAAAQAEDNPVCTPIWQIPVASFDDLAKIGNDPCYPLSGSYKLMNDIDVSWLMNDGRGFVPIGTYLTPCLVPPCPYQQTGFTGEFDGGGHTISGLYIYNSYEPVGEPDYDIDNNNNILPSDPFYGYENVGLFGIVDGGTVKNLRLADVFIESAGEFGGGRCGAEIYECYPRGNAGAVAGWVMPGSNIVDVSVSGWINGLYNVNVGGIVGYIGIPERMITNACLGEPAGTGTNCVPPPPATILRSSSSVSGGGGMFLPAPPEFGSVGGIAGVVGYYAVLEQSFSTGNFSGFRNHFGGLVGALFGAVRNCYFNGSINIFASTYNNPPVLIGGIAGVITDGSVIRNSYAVMRISGNRDGGAFDGIKIGGLVGDDIGMTDVVRIYDSYWDEEVSGIPHNAGGGIGRLTWEMMRLMQTNISIEPRPTYTNWDFEDIWQFGQTTATYPYFRYQSGYPTSVRGGSIARNRSVKNAAASVSVRGRMLNVRMAEGSKSSSNAPMQIRMIDMRGRTVARFNAGANASGRSHSFALTKIPAGRYFVEVRDGVRRDRVSVVVGVK